MFLFPAGPRAAVLWQSLLARVPGLDSGQWLMFLCRRRPRLSFILRARDLPFVASSARTSPVAGLRPVAHLYGPVPLPFALWLLSPLSIAAHAVHTSLFLQDVLLQVYARTDSQVYARMISVISSCRDSQGIHALVRHICVVSIPYV